MRADSEDPWAHLALGCVYPYLGRIDDALTALEVALRLNPNFSLAQGFYGLVLSWAGRWREGTEFVRRAIRLSPRDPFSAIYYAVAGYAAYVERNYEEAIRLAKVCASAATLLALTVCSWPPRAWRGKSSLPRQRRGTCGRR